MSPRRSPTKNREAVRLLAVDSRRHRFEDARAEELPRLLDPGDLLVVNEAATLPASLFGTTETGERIELRLCGHGDRSDRFRAVLFGEGDWRMRTEDRPAPPAVAAGERLTFGELSGLVTGVSPISGRMIDVELDRRGSELWQALYSIGRPVQYSYLAADLELEAVQTSYGVRPFAFEMPSAGRPLSFGILSDLRARGVRVATLLHAAGLSATGDPVLDALLPLPEQYQIPPETVAAIEDAHAAGRRVIAVGTTVVRALEGCHREHGRLIAGKGVTDLVIDEGFVPAVVDALVSNLHEPGESHYRLLRAFADDDLLRSAVAHAERQGYHNHELGDLMLLS
jgi:S-adenosylmethionine:tRNA ribosyltransferase-isomerase